MEPSDEESAAVRVQRWYRNVSNERRELNRQQVHDLLGPTKQKMLAHRTGRGGAAVGGDLGPTTARSGRPSKKKKSRGGRRGTSSTVTHQHPVAAAGGQASTKATAAPMAGEGRPSPRPAAVASAVKPPSTQPSLLDRHNLQRLRSLASARQRRVGGTPESDQPRDDEALTHPQPAAAKPPTAKAAIPPADGDHRLANLIGFLDSVDENQSKIEAELGGLRMPRRGQMLATGDVVQPTGGAVAIDPSHAETATAVTRMLVQQQLELKEKEATIAALEQKVQQNEQVAEAAAATTHRAASPPKRSGSGLAAPGLSAEEQLAEANRTINRHLGFIDRLIHDKKALSERCEQLVAQLKGAETKFAARLDELRDGHKAELRKRKEAAATAEKQRREKWIKEQTKRIKDMTVKGLEPEIQRLIQEHKAEIARVREARPSTAADMEAVAAAHKAELAETATQNRAAQAEAVAAARLEAQKEAEDRAVAAERDFQAERRRLLDEQAALKAEGQREVARAREEARAEFTARRQADEAASLALKQDTERLLRESSQRHEREVAALKEQLAIEKESWEDMFMRKQAAQLKTKEAAVREELRAERDRQINMVIGRLEEENTRRTEENDRQYDARVRRIREQYQAQLHDAEQAEKSCLAKYNECRQKLVASTEEAASLRGMLTQREQDLARANELGARLSAERDRVSDIVRAEFAEQLASRETELERARLEVQGLKDKSYREVTQLRNEKDAELDRLHNRVEAAIAKKDETIAVLRDKAATASRRADHLVELLDTQRQHLGQGSGQS
mmetsp:Transcript_33985/g.102494  ORF Transcript_33985/g.102494 Transcript_33985/m.102494 type:complete len:795 (-) Transcript_33985:2400-4784(-)